MITTGWRIGGEPAVRAVPAVPGARDRPPPEPQGTVHERVRSSAEFVRLRRRLRWFVFPATAVFLVWYLAFVLLVSYHRDLMDQPLVGDVNIGLALGLLQFASTFALTAGYVRYARRRLDPLAERIRERIESVTVPEQVGGPR